MLCSASSDTATQTTSPDHELDRQHLRSHCRSRRQWALPLHAQMRNSESTAVADIYIYICVCVCVCAREREVGKTKSRRCVAVVTRARLKTNEHRVAIAAAHTGFTCSGPCSIGTITSHPDIHARSGSGGDSGLLDMGRECVTRRQLKEGKCKGAPEMSTSKAVRSVWCCSTYSPWVHFFEKGRDVFGATCRFNVGSLGSVCALLLFTFGPTLHELLLLVCCSGAAGVIGHKLTHPIPATFHIVGKLFICQTVIIFLRLRIDVLVVRVFQVILTAPCSNSQKHSLSTSSAATSSSRDAAAATSLGTGQNRPS